MNLANKITFFRIVLVPVFLFVFLNTDIPNYRLISTAIFLIASLTDTLDGYIARSRNLVTNLGKFLDPLADKLLVSAALIAFVQTNEISSVVVIIIISREFIITGFRAVAAEKNVVIAASFWGKLKTIFQMIMIMYVLTDFYNYNQTTIIIKDILIILTVIFTILSAVDYLYKNKKVMHD